MRLTAWIVMIDTQVNIWTSFSSEVGQWSRFLYHQSVLAFWKMTITQVKYSPLRKLLCCRWRWRWRRLLKTSEGTFPGESDQWIYIVLCQSNNLTHQSLLLDICVWLWDFWLSNPFAVLNLPFVTGRFGFNDSFDLPDWFQECQPTNL